MTAFLAHTDPPIDGCDTAPVNEACAKVAGLQQELARLVSALQEGGAARLMDQASAERA